MGRLVDVDKSGKDLLAKMTLQKRGVPVQASAPDSADKMSEQAAGNLGGKDNRRLLRGQTPRPQPPHCTLRRMTAYVRRTLQLPAIPRSRIPVITLHAIFIAGDHGTT